MVSLNLGINFYAVMADIGAVKGWHAIAQTALLEKPLLTLNHGASAQGVPSNLLFYYLNLHRDFNGLDGKKKKPLLQPVIFSSSRMIKSVADRKGLCHR
jgi:hypothetical protein